MDNEKKELDFDISMDDKYKELTLELQEKYSEIESITKKLNEIYEQVYELEEIIKNYKTKESIILFYPNGEL